MNLREETIKVLREVTDNYDPGVDDAFEDGYETEVVVSMGLIRIARSLLSRLEAGSGEETGWQPIETAPKDGTRILAILKNPIPHLREDLRVWDGIPFVARHPGLADDGFDIGWNFAAPVGSGGFPDEWIAGWRPIPPLNQEGADAALVSDEEIDNPTDRPHVATPAPGENSGRADPPGEKLISALLEADRTYIDVDLTGSAGLTNGCAARRAFFEAKQALLDHIVHMNEIGFAAGRRSGLEEAAKAVNEEAALATTFVETATYGRAATIIRAIPEKQSP